jgi:hypothetical protein
MTLFWVNWLRTVEILVKQPLLGGDLKNSGKLGILSYILMDGRKKGERNPSSENVVLSEAMEQLTVLFFKWP